VDYHRELEHLESQRLQITLLTALVESDIFRVEQGRWPVAAGGRGRRGPHGL
jgi:hypothetical protein